MIRINLNEANFEYDIYHLIKAFYPQDEVVLNTPETQKTNNKKTGEEEEIVFEGIVQYSPDKLKLSFQYQDGTRREREESIDYHNRKETKNCLKRMLYQMLFEVTGKTLPWGTLTGIRPVKIFSDLFEEGKTEAEVKRRMKETYYVSEEKTKLGISIAKTEKQLIQKVKGTYSIYIGIPFCPTTCLYCSFPSFPVSMWKNRMGEYLDALFKELDFLSRTVDPKKISTVYIGGGTPTSFDAALLDRLLKKVTECFYHPDLLEFTVEAGRPDSITKEKLQVMRRYPISRISINPQTMKQETLDYIGRHHTVEQTIRCFEMAREEGFDNINMDLILGLPGEGNEDVSHTMEEIKKLNPENLTVHSLAQKRASRLRMFRENYEKDLISDTEEMMKIATGGAESLGMKPYYLYRQKNMSGNLENIGFAKPGKEGVYNILMMEEVQHILAAGAGAMSKFVFDTGEIHRVENVKDVKNYLERTEEMMERKQKFFRNHPLDGNFLCNL